MKLEIEIINEEKTVFSGQGDFIAVPGEQGEIGVLPGHAKFFSTLNPGTVRIRNQESEQTVDIHQGFIEIDSDRVRIFTSSLPMDEE